MSSLREVLIRIALLQRKTLIEPKNRALKCLKWHSSTLRSMKNVAVFMEDGAFALLFRPHPGEFDSSRVLTLGNFDMVTINIHSRFNSVGERQGRFSTKWPLRYISSSHTHTCARAMWYSKGSQIYIRGQNKDLKVSWLYLLRQKQNRNKK